MDVLRLLQSKNRILRHLVTLAQDFVRLGQDAPELPDLTNLERRRERVFTALQLLDQKISSAVLAIPLQARTEPFLDQVRAAVNQSEETVREILSLDERVLELIEREKSRLQGELNQSERSKALARKYRSAWVSEPGEELDQKL